VTGVVGERRLEVVQVVNKAGGYALMSPRYYKPAYPVQRTLEIMDGMSGTHLDPEVVAAVHRSLPRLEQTVAELRATWPKPGDDGIGSLAGAMGELSERDRPAPARPAS